MLILNNKTVLTQVRMEDGGAVWKI